jgi:DNA-binding NarL/FixJ family response regulator
MKKLRILFADDNTAFRGGLRRLLEAQSGYEVVAEAVNGAEAVEKATLFQPDIVILDYSMPEMDGLTAAARIHLDVPRAEIIILTQHDAAYTVQRALEAGARGYVVKSDASHDLLPALEAMRQHQQYVSPVIARAPETSDE